MSKGIQPGQPFDITEDIATQLESLDEICIKVLNKALLLGEVVILTNSTNGWVEISSKIFLPQVHKFLSKIKVISAPEQFPHLAIQNCKVEVFKELIADNILNVLSFGDSSNDRESLFLAIKDNNYIYSKNFKFLKTPTIDELKTQFQIFVNNIDDLSAVNKNLDMILEIQNE